MVTDYDCWHPGHDAVTVDQVISVLLGNAQKATALLQVAVPMLQHSAPSPAHTALEFALITAPEKRDPAMIARLDAVAGRVLNR